MRQTQLPSNAQSFISIIWLPHSEETPMDNAYTQYDGIRIAKGTLRPDRRPLKEPSLVCRRLHRRQCAFNPIRTHLQKPTDPPSRFCVSVLRVLCIFIIITIFPSPSQAKSFQIVCLHTERDRENAGNCVDVDVAVAGSVGSVHAVRAALVMPHRFRCRTLALHFRRVHSKTKHATATPRRPRRARDDNKAHATSAKHQNSVLLHQKH